MIDIVIRTTYVSLLAQFLTGIYGIYGLFHAVPSTHHALKTSLQIEMFVQLIEFIFYLWFVSHFHLASMAPTRYRDWVVTTPLLLISAMLYFYYEEKRQQGQDTTNAVRDFIREHLATIAIVVVANFFMIAFGYAGEVGWLSMPTSVTLGFVAFGIAFYTMWARLASKSTVGNRLFWFIAIVWTFYGVAFMFPMAEKNIAYNLLDVVAKNFFGVYLAYKVVQASRV
jgi:bacteriorhodopsin